MQRDLDYTISFGETEEFRLIREMFETQPSNGIYEGYRVEGNSQSVQFTPEQFALLHRAIHEMLRMHDQHLDALTDGAEQQPAKSDPAPDEAEGEYSREQLDYLLMLAATTITIKMGHPGFGLLFNTGLLEITEETASLPTMNREYTISDKGRAFLAAQEEA